MSASEIPLTDAEKRMVACYTCDGVPRFNVGPKKGLTYSQAREALIRSTGGSVGTDAEPRNVVTREGIKRLGKLNAAYLSAARPFLIENAKKQPPEEPK